MSDDFCYHGAIAAHPSIGPSFGNAHCLNCGAWLISDAERDALRAKLKLTMDALREAPTPPGVIMSFTIKETQAINSRLREYGIRMREWYSGPRARALEDE